MGFQCVRLSYLRSLRYVLVMLLLPKLAARTEDASDPRGLGAVG